MWHGLIVLLLYAYHGLLYLGRSYPPGKAKDLVNIASFPVHFSSENFD